MLRVICRIITWLCCAFAFTDAALVIWDGCRPELSIGTRVVTFVVAGFFALIGVAGLGVEWNLNRLRRFTVAEAEAVGWQRTWRHLHLFLIPGMLFVLLVVFLGLTGILSRFQEGRPLFG